MQKGKINVTTENIFPIIKKFLYSDHEIFLRELISNAVDATQKLKTLASVGEFKGELGDLTIRVDVNKKKKTLTVSDAGIWMTAQEVEKYSYKYLRDESLNGIDCFVIERDPVDEYSGYTRQVVWIDKAEYRPQQIVYYDRKNAKLKTLVFSDYRQYLDTYWRAHVMEMENHQTGKSTRLTWSDYRFQTGLTERDFNRNNLDRVR